MAWRLWVPWCIAVALVATACTDLGGSQVETEVTTATPRPDSSTPAFHSADAAAIAAAISQEPTLENPQVTHIVGIYTDDTSVDLRVQVETDRFCHWYGVGGRVQAGTLQWRASPAVPCQE